MKKTSVVALSLIFGLLSLSPVYAQEIEDPFEDGILGDLFSELESFESESTDEFEATESDSSSIIEDPLESPAEEDSSSQESNSAADTPLKSEDSQSQSDPNAAEADPASRAQSSRLAPIAEIPAGKEKHLLYNIPGAIEYRGMTFLRIDSRKFFNRFQPCDTTAEDKTTNALARLKISQGAPLECREDMKYQFMPYRTYRATR